MSVFHLKSRPKTLSELDLLDVSEKLRKILASKDLPQSFLFAGPKGSGKTSAARIVAKVINCEAVVDGDACDNCENCRQIKKGNSIDILEIDAASNRGIEDIRDLKDKAYLLPAKLKRKVIIIDEVHMLTKEAFNALLKLIEEPPAHTFFILCTTDSQKIPETVLSRLVRIDFHKGSENELAKSLRRTIDEEKIEITEESVAMIIDKSDGSFRNLQKTLNELVIEYGQNISSEQVKLFLEKRYGDYTPSQLEDDLVIGDLKSIITKIEKIAESGVDFKLYRENLISYFQDRLLGSCGVENKQKSKLTLDKLEKWLQLLIAAGKQEKEVSIDQLPIQLAIVAFLASNSGTTRIVEAKSNEEKIVVEQKKTVNNVNLGFGVDKVSNEWGKILVAVKPYNHSVEAFLRSARPFSIQGNLLTLEVFYPFHKDKLEEQKNRKIVETGLRDVLGVEMSFECILGNSKKDSLIIQNDTSEVMVGGGDIYDVAKEIFG